jgi:hypothetical protein
LVIQLYSPCRRWDGNILARAFQAETLEFLVLIDFVQKKLRFRMERSLKGEYTKRKKIPYPSRESSGRTIGRSRKRETRLTEANLFLRSSRDQATSHVPKLNRSLLSQRAGLERSAKDSVSLIPRRLQQGIRAAKVGGGGRAKVKRVSRFVTSFRGRRRRG